MLIVVGFAAIVFGAIPFGLGLKFGSKSRGEHGKFGLSKVALIFAGLTIVAVGPFLNPDSGPTAILTFCIVGPGILGWCLGYLGFSRLIAAPFGLCLLFGLPVLAALPIQWWRSIPQDQCAFDSINPDKVQQMKGKLAGMRRIPWFQDDAENKPSIIERIEALAPPEKSTIPERLAAAHLVMRSDGYVLAKGYTPPGKPFDPTPVIDMDFYEREYESPRDRSIEYHLIYIGPPYYGFHSGLGAWSGKRHLSLMISHRAGENVKYKTLQKELKCTDVSLLIPGFKGPSADSPLSRDYSCPRMPSAVWVNSVPDRVCHVAD